MPVYGYGLGRNVEHDVRSWHFPARRVEPKTVLWEHNAPVLDQGQLGSCTGNALAQCLNTEFFKSSRPNGVYLTEGDAVALYSKATELDDFPGEYPPTDTGSSGLAVCKAGIQHGFLTGYTHPFGIDDVMGALTISPLIVGIDWYYSMETPDGDGFVWPKGKLAGGHEIVLLGQDLEQGDFTFLNSWSDKWGLNGRFKMKAKVFANLLANEGDATVPVGINVAPDPVPPPQPEPEPAKPNCNDMLQKIIDFVGSLKG